MSLEKLRAKLQSANLDAFIISQPENRRYISGFTGSAGLLLVSQTEQALVTDARYYQYVRQNLPDWPLVEAGYKTADYVLQTLEAWNLPPEARIGFEADDWTVTSYQKHVEALEGFQLVETEHFVTELRASKTQDELLKLQKPIDLTDETVTYLYETIKPGQTEREVAWNLEKFMRSKGAESLSFDIIVAAGPNGALPHAHPGNRALQAGDVVVVDMGCVIDGYVSDLTRTFSLGQPGPEEFLTVWQVVYEAQQNALQGLKAGMVSKTADALARDVIKEAGYGDYFSHSLGHGIGLNVHELPRLSYTSEQSLPANAVVTVEPGIYLPDRFGVRLEDVAHISETGVNILSAAPCVSQISL